MRDIAEYTENTNPYELFTHIYWCIIKRKITLVSELEEYLAPIPEGPAKAYTFKSAFRMIKEMHWGFFSALDPSDYPLLWKQLTLPHSTYPDVGELKRSMSITDIYTAFIDIHGYTAFCQTHGKHISMLQLLDSCIENDIRRICRNNHVMGNRARGDEIILVGTSAYDVVNTVIMIADYFGDGKLAANKDIIRERNGQTLKLPKLTISAGIAGGKKYAVLAITAAGDLSGSVVNTAARLQGRANKIAWNKNHILTTNQVVFSYKKSLAKQDTPLIPPGSTAFLDLGPVGFKGVELRLAEVVIEPDQMYRASYQDSLDKMIEALQSRSWSERIILALCDLITATTRAIPPFEVPLPESRGGLLSLSNETVILLMDKICDRIINTKDYASALEDLLDLEDIMNEIENFDHAVLLYLHTVAEGYRHILPVYSKYIGAYSKKNMETLFSLEERRKFQNAKMSSQIYTIMEEELPKRIGRDKRKSLWTRLTKEMGGEIEALPYLAK